ncbi:hypothetical protein GDO86_000641 [Hymenochirus boettgeri]|uniref:Calcium uniporter protein n=1 Tax=Hymenochirus boettgeri TaxID=247094 RepID=A0A8T2KF90_9PIPI|nr:hypothetical protein GDO86_000641 [Hymenochirus boettgeri]
MMLLTGFYRTLPLAAGSQIRCLTRNLRINSVVSYNTQSPSSDVTVHYNHGLPVVTLPLPSRKERCQFTIKPLTTTVGTLLKDIKNEDRGIDLVAAVSTDNTRFCASTLMDFVLMNNFKLIINNITYHVQPPPRANPCTQDSSEIDAIKSMVHRLHAALHQGEHCIKKEEVLQKKLEHLKEQLQPLEQMKASILVKSDAKTTRLTWIGLALLSTQGGALAWLTWWVYSWDIMEPVTYFITYGSAIAFYAYFVLTKQDYVYPDIRDRQMLRFFYSKAKTQRFDVEEYNRLREEFAETEENLRRLRNPLQLGLPIEQLREKE